eukprot:IDg14296t1
MDGRSRWLARSAVHAPAVRCTRPQCGARARVEGQTGPFMIRRGACSLTAGAINRAPRLIRPPTACSSVTYPMGPQRSAPRSNCAESCSERIDHFNFSFTQDTVHRCSVLLNCHPASLRLARSIHEARALP